MRDLFLVLLYMLLIAACVMGVVMDIRMSNIERQLTRIEYDYQVVVAENKQLHRVNEQNLFLLTQGGWNEMASSRAAD